VNNEAMSSALGWWLESTEYRALLERTRDGLLALERTSMRTPSRLLRTVNACNVRWTV
jgi:hypothetical protein